ncbi:hypothetical protein [Telluribacter humicola]|uniref:hypothetical protein n=1 Tax=Telluribacter humicola TaxID=1720261 RepID=UPI001A967117|nr:hypothetical protein [Telluribacter humicola]
MLVRLIINLYKYFRIQALYKKYIDYIKNDTLSFAEYKSEIKSLFQEAEIKDFGVQYQERLGYGRLAEATVSGFENMTYRGENVFIPMRMRFFEAKGVFRKRCYDSINPLFWIEFLVKLPEHLFKYFGVLPEKVIVKIFLVIYWLVALFFGAKKLDIVELLTK